MKVSIFKKKTCADDVLTNNLLDNFSKYGFEIDDNNPDVVFCVGGDGTFLQATQKYLNLLDKIIFIGVCAKGSLGFFYDCGVNEIPEMLEALSAKEYKIEQLNMIEAKLVSKKETKSVFAVNEVRIENPFHTLISEVTIDGVHLEKFRGNGLIVATSIGSSAYNRSLGGALIEPSLNLLELTEIAPIQHNEYRSLGSSLIVDGKRMISLSGDFNSVVVGFDCLTYSDNDLERIDITLSDKKINLLRSNRYTYVNKLEKSFIK